MNIEEYIQDKIGSIEKIHGRDFDDLDKDELLYIMADLVIDAVHDHDIRTWANKVLVDAASAVEEDMDKDPESIEVF
jgi:hypothetical protein